MIKLIFSHTGTGIERKVRESKKEKVCVSVCLYGRGLATNREACRLINSLIDGVFYKQTDRQKLKRVGRQTNVGRHTVILT